MTDRKSIVIIGDWFLDENWLVTKYNAFASSHPGNIHYLSKQKEITSPIVGLCGVPAILNVLRSYLGEDYPIAAFGIWNRDDRYKLKCIVCKRGKKKKQSLLNPFTTSGLKDVKDGKCPYFGGSCKFDSKLYNLAKGQNRNISTNRVIRVYEGHRGGTPQILSRYDWILPIPSNTNEREQMIDYERLENYLKKENIGHIIIEDHAMGLISDGMISRIIKTLESSDKLDDVKWYIRSKTEHPTWLTLLNNKLKDINRNITLKVVNYSVALEKKGPRIWRFGNVLGRASLELLGEFSGSATYKNQKEKLGIESPIQKIAILNDDNTVIAKHLDDCYNIEEPLGPRQQINVGRTTMFFSCLIAQDIADPQSDFAIHCRKAVYGAYAWSKGITEAWKREDFDFYNYNNVVNAVKKADLKSSINYYRNSYNGAWQEWNESSQKLGIITTKPQRKIIQLWRGEGAVKKYVCVGSEKRTQINNLLAGISAFNRQDNPSYPFNCLLVSNPGWGKSYLAKCLAAECNMSYMEFSISQMATTKDLIDSFDAICSHQNRTDQKVLIFMDEINCLIEGNSAMGLLLSPIWDGSFIRDGKYYRLLPAVWIFASTTPLYRLADEETNKGSDFISRLNGTIIDLDYIRSLGKHGRLAETLRDIKRMVTKGVSIDNIHNSPSYKTLLFKIRAAHADYVRTETVYICLSLLNKIWGPINSIEEEVLKLFSRLVTINGVRSLEFFISKFQYIQHGVVRCKNVPLYGNAPELLRHVVYPPKWKNGIPSKIKYTNLIEIETMVK